MIDDFDGDNERLIACIEALLDLDAAKALVPHGIGGHARGLLSAAGVRLATKDREIAELIAQLDSARYNAEAADSFRAAYLRERDEALEHLTEARECVKRLYIALSAVKETVIDYAPTLVVRDALDILNATPEHLR